MEEKQQVAQEHPLSPQPNTETFHKKSKRVYYIISGIAFIVLLVLIGVGIFLRSRSQETMQHLSSSGQQNYGQQQGNNDPIMQALGCTSQQSCNELCQKPENRAKCQQVFQQYGQQNRTGNYNPNAPQEQSNVGFAMAGNNGDTTTANLPDCTSNTLFDHLPTDTTAYTGVEPLGHMNGEHVLPDQADHVYINIVSASNTSSQLTTVYAPGNVTLLQAMKKSNYINGSNVTDYLLEFSPCKSVIFTYDHIRNLNSKILNAINGKTPICQQGGVHLSCTYPNLSVKLSSGEKIGTAGGPDTFSLAFDFGGADIRTKQLAFLDTSPSVQTGVTGDSYFHTVCPLDYFTSALKNALYSKLTIKNAGANGIPACGTTMQDLAGTAQGNWYHQGATQAYQGLDIQGALAIVHSNLDPTKGVISAGIDLFPNNGDLGAQIEFTPQASGYINREPSQIKPDGHTYCFDGPIMSGGNGEEGHVNIQFINTTTLHLNYGNGACAANPTVTNPLTYVR